MAQLLLFAAKLSVPYLLYLVFAVFIMARWVLRNMEHSIIMRELEQGCKDRE